MDKFERKSGISRVLRADAEVFQDLYHDILDNNLTRSYEVAKSPEWIEALGQINSFLREFVSEYGGEFIEVPAKLVGRISPVVPATGLKNSVDFIVLSLRPFLSL
ncbi:MAG: hypothetical protein UT53_C0014G0019 [Candidatus Yanofskybacteria bacterium GW2011_GWD2_39_48]|uniref:Uncharacterized protein n=1 Tax=Candidatus Yanofskybacteria bacterium GW2011_GWD2_39_48 TaxID=1619031 RepID=A0A0G0PEE7_9BACT|nr:MAG: hypothetical protein UT53_C0014G0019 [Candidatus Yanofskybacteria bacterium GW2011_GWD2_39_48]